MKIHTSILKCMSLVALLAAPMLNAEKTKHKVAHDVALVTTGVLGGAVLGSAATAYQYQNIPVTSHLTNQARQAADMVVNAISSKASSFNGWVTGCFDSAQASEITTRSAMETVKASAKSAATNVSENISALAGWAGNKAASAVTSTKDIFNSFNSNFTAQLPTQESFKDFVTDSRFIGSAAALVMAGSAYYAWKNYNAEIKSGLNKAKQSVAENAEIAANYITEELKPSVSMLKKALAATAATVTPVAAYKLSPAVKANVDTAASFVRGQLANGTDYVANIAGNVYAQLPTVAGTKEAVISALQNGLAATASYKDQAIELVKQNPKTAAAVTAAVVVAPAVIYKAYKAYKEASDVINEKCTRVGNLNKEASNLD